MKIRLLFLFLSAPLFSFSQVKSSVDLVGGVEYSYRYLNNTSDDPIIQIIFDSRDGETGKMNFRGGFNYNRRLSKHLWIRSGVRLASIGYKFEKTELRWPSEYDPNTGEYTPDPTLPHELQAINDYWFLEIPVMGRFEMGEGKWRPFVELGMSPNIYLTTRAKEVTDLSTKVSYLNNTMDNFNRLHFSGNLSIGMQYQATERLAVFLQPVFRYHFTPLYDAPIKEHLYNYGIEIGLRKGFR